MPISDIVFSPDELPQATGPGSPSNSAHAALPLLAELAESSAGILLASTVIIETAEGEEFTLTAGTLINGGMRLGFISGIIGSVDPSSFNSASFLVLSTLVNPLDPPSDGFYLTFAGTLSQNFFTSITINGTTLLSSAAAFSTDAAPSSQWFWAGSFPYGVEGVYPFTLIP